jgi:hypothetical protein
MEAEEAVLSLTSWLILNSDNVKAGLFAARMNISPD